MSRRRRPIVSGGMRVPRGYRHSISWLHLPSLLAPPAPLPLGRLLTLELLLQVVSLPLLTVALPRRSRSLCRVPRHRWGGADLRDGGTQAPRHRDIPVSGHGEVLRGCISSISWLRLTPYPRVTFIRRSFSFRRHYSRCYRATLQRRVCSFRCYPRHRQGRRQRVPCLKHVLGPATLHAAVGKGGSASSSSSAFRTPRVHLVRRSSQVESRPAGKS